ncbi:MAG: flagellar hook-associated protein FlgK [Melioribacteraceae bacterium]|nr:flagellar hook-associated protein FlgK [Melioribacteraceae bacterium]
MGISRLLDISVRSMAAYQRAMDVTSQNISNAGNPEYSRQKTLFATEETQLGIGMGVKIQDVLRIRNEMIDNQIRRYQSSLYDAEKRTEMYKQLESIIAEPSEIGLSTYFSEFFNSWSELATNPNSTQLRTNVVQKAQRLSERFAEIFEGFTNVQSVLQREAVTKTNQVNSYLKEIAELNHQIYESEARGIKASELKDRRDLMIDNLSQLVNVTVNINEHGAAIVNVGGVQGADQNEYNEFEVSIINNKMRIVSKIDQNSIVVLNGGELNALTDLYSNKIPEYRENLEDLARVFVDKVNQYHMQGYTLVQNGNSSTGIPFFGTLDINGSVEGAFINGQIKINENILKNPKNIAVSGEAGNDGNGAIANILASLGDLKLSELGDQSMMENYTFFLNNFGIEKVVSDNKIESNGLVLQQLQNQRASYSGVSIDEEMTNVIKYQRSYEASAKLIKVVNEMMETILQMV